MNDVDDTDPTNVALLTENPVDVERCTSYSVTPTSSDDADHDTVGVDPDTDTATPDGTLGAVVSAGALPVPRA